jgi:hypothetical protein
MPTPVFSPTQAAILPPCYEKVCLGQLHQYHLEREVEKGEGKERGMMVMRKKEKSRKRNLIFLFKSSFFLLSYLLAIFIKAS